VLIPGVGESVRQVSIRNTTSLPVALLVSVLNPLFEEVLNLGFVQRLLSKHGLAFALGSAVMLRLITHLYQGPLAAVAILPLGIVFGIYFHFRRELLPVVIAHGLLDFDAFSQA
jgi:membrane protease YdiL (CAAX protease family)